MKIEPSVSAKPLSERGKLILNAAQNLFLKNGYDDTSLEMIISDSGGSRRNIYSEFGNKHGLLMAVIREQVIAQVNTLIDIDYDLPPEAALTDVCTRFVEGFLSETLIALFRLVTNIVPKIPEVGELIYMHGPLTGCKPVASYLDWLNNQQLLDIDDSDFAAKILIEMVKGRLHLKAILIPNEPITKQEIDEHISASVRLFLKAYQA